MKKKKDIKVIRIVLLSLAIIFTIFYIYTLDYYKALPVAQDILSTEKNIEIEQGKIVITSEGTTDTGFIFYPGGKVEYTSYLPLMEKLAEKGYTCILMKMPFNLAVFNVNAAEKVFEEFPDIKNWYIGGHSLGGVMASSFAKDNSEKLKGLVLLGAYPHSDLSDTRLSVLSIYGEHDRVLNREKFEKNKAYAPADTLYLEIPGGNHAYFGSYGEQQGDGAADITAEEQQSFTAEAIKEFISNP